MEDSEIKANILKDQLATHAWGGSFPHRDLGRLAAKTDEYNHAARVEELGRPVGRAATRATRNHNYEYEVVRLDNYDPTALTTEGEE